MVALDSNSQYPHFYHHFLGRHAKMRRRAGTRPAPTPIILSFNLFCAFSRFSRLPSLHPSTRSILHYTNFPPHRYSDTPLLSLFHSSNHPTIQSSISIVYPITPLFSYASRVLALWSLKNSRNATVHNIVKKQGTRNTPVQLITFSVVK